MTTQSGQYRSPPQLLETEETHALIRQRIATLPEQSQRGGWVNEPDFVEAAVDTLGRSAVGKHGWKATLLGDTIIRSGSFGTPYLLMDILPPLCDWWEEMANEAILNCPAPENVRYHRRDRYGRRRMKNTVRDGYDRWDVLLFDDQDWGNLHLPMLFTFDGKASVGDTLWPFDPTTLIDPMVERIQAALGTQPFTGWDGRKRKVRPWAAEEIGGRKSWTKRRIYEDWSGRSAAERNVLSKPPMPLLKPSARWPQMSGYLAGSICGGDANCGYEPKRTPEAPRVNSGCNRIWRTYSRSLFDAFMAANPEVQFGPKAECLQKLRQPQHRCYGKRGANCIKRGGPLDHDQMCRFPDNQRFIISQPYCGDDLCEYDLKKIREWQKKDPEITWRIAGATRSWYFPTHSNLLIVGHEKTIDRLALNYPVPNVDEPTNCVRWRSPAN